MPLSESESISMASALLLDTRFGGELDDGFAIKRQHTVDERVKAC